MSLVTVLLILWALFCFGFLWAWKRHWDNLKRDTIPGLEDDNPRLFGDDVQ